MMIEKESIPQPTTISILNKFTTAYLVEQLFNITKEDPNYPNMMRRMQSIKSGSQQPTPELRTALGRFANDQAETLLRFSFNVRISEPAKPKIQPLPDRFDYSEYESRQPIEHKDHLIHICSGGYPFVISKNDQPLGWFENRSEAENYINNI